MGFEEGKLNQLVQQVVISSEEPRDPIAQAVAAEKENVKRLLQHMQEPPNYLLNKEGVGFSLLKKIPLFSRVLKNSSEMGNKILQLSDSIKALHESMPSESISGMQYGAIALAALDFFLIPIIYFAAFMFNEKAPITVSNNARWVYSAVLLGLTLTAIFVPVTAPVIGLITASFAVVFTSLLLSKAIHERYLLGKEKRLIIQAVAAAEEEMSLIQHEAQEMGALLDTDETEILIEAYAQVSALQERYDAQKKRVEELKDKAFVIDEKIKKVGLLQVMDKAIGVLFASVAFAGVIVALFFPPAGLAIVAGVSLVSLTYLTLRITTPLFRMLGNWLITTIREAFSNKPQGSNENQPELTPSTRSILEHLVSKEELALKAQNEEDTLSTQSPETISLPSAELTEQEDAAEGEVEEEDDAEGETRSPHSALS